MTDRAATIDGSDQVLFGRRRAPLPTGAELDAAIATEVMVDDLSVDVNSQADINQALKASYRGSRAGDGEHPLHIYEWGEGHIYTFLVDGITSFVPHEVGLDFYRSRGRREYAADLEAYIANYRKKPHRYSSDIALALEVQERILARGLEEKYVRALREITSAPVATSVMALSTLATPTQRCQAALLAVRGTR